MSLSNAQKERLVCLIEEMSEATKAASKILRFGYDSRSPKETDQSRNNRVDLEKELADVNYWVNKMCNAGDIDWLRIVENENQKTNTVNPCLLYQEE